MMRASLRFLRLLLCLPVLAACTPTVRVEAPQEPIEINLNVRIEHDVRIRTEKDLEKTIAGNPDLFGVSP